MDDTDSYIPYTALGQSSSTPFYYCQPSVSWAALPLKDITNKLTEEPTVSTTYDMEFPPLPTNNSGNIKPTLQWNPSLIQGKSLPTGKSSPQVLHQSSYPNPLHDDGNTPQISKSSLLAFLPLDGSTPSPIWPCDTPNGSDTTCHLTVDQFYKLFGHCRFCNYANFCLTAKDSKFINGGNPIPSLGEFATIPKRKRGDPLPCPTQAFDKVHLDIVFGDGLGHLGYKYAFVFVDHATGYIRVFGLKNLHADAIIAAFQ